jgi:serine/threonine-protein kinase
MGRCPTCGTTYEDESLFCSHDGTRLLPLPGADAPESRLGAAPPVEGGPAAPRVPLAGECFDQRYLIERQIGDGGMSVVYLGTDEATGERVALKVLSASLSRDENAMARLRREASLGMRVAHPNVCHIIRLGETDDGLVYLVMPYVQGETLAARCARRGVLPLAEVVRHVVDIGAGLQAAHELQIVHRDLKPENVMICPVTDGTERAVVMDFGLAKARHAGPELQKLTATGIVLGTPEFMSPEQLRGKPLDGRTDLYSLALMTFETLTGRLPFTGATQQEMMIARLETDPTPLREARPDLDFPEALERVLLKAMSRDPDDRYPTALELSSAVATASRYA